MPSSFFAYPTELVSTIQMLLSNMRSKNISLILTLSLASCGEDCNRPDRCDMTPQTNICYAAIPRYYYDREDKKCKEYIWGGCVEFPFKTLEECQVCECKD